MIASSGRVLFSVSGPDNDNMRAVSFDLRPFAGAKIFVRLVEEATAGWGHVNLVDFVFHDSQPLRAEEVPLAPLTANLPARMDLRAGRLIDRKVSASVSPRRARSVCLASKLREQIVIRPRFHFPGRAMQCGINGAVG